jgi:phage portal protein BeeE
MNGRKQTVKKPTAQLIRNFSRNNTIVRRCVNIIKDAIVKKKFVVESIDGNDNEELIKIFTNIFKYPNADDSNRSFLSMVAEDCIVGDNGCFEVAIGGNPERPVYLFPVDGMSIDFVIGDPTVKYAQKQTDFYGAGGDYKYFTADQIVYMKKQVFSYTPYGLSPIESAFDYIRALTNTFDYSAEVASNVLPKYLANIKGINGDVLNAYRSYFEMDVMGTPNLPLVSAEDVKSVQIAPISEEATYKAYQEFVIGIIAISFGIPPEKLAIAKSNDRSTIDEVNENLLSDCVIPYCDVIEEGFNKAIDILGFSDKIAGRFIHEETQAQRKARQDMVVSLFTLDVVPATYVCQQLNIEPPTDEYANDRISLYKAKVNADYGTNGFAGVGDAVANNAGKGGDNNNE